ncbi:hypothetical protein RW1_060_00230 [Rhodococcus wratislaviensis NBRC 100605]|uniref:Uncharacterized protein n=1 Tax=Rhodococcus wratislaviensis NBRC 100605 TaxID=1219028 RepID=X0PYW1_RHOWR|nr:hypothetical protein RW1_060_00230 [Rhodococcus wratislaviensis NBRC 100605]
MVHDWDEVVPHPRLNLLFGLFEGVGGAVVDAGFEVLAGGAGGSVGAGVFIVAEPDGDAVGGAWGGLLGERPRNAVLGVPSAARGRPSPCTLRRPDSAFVRSILG